MNALACRVCEDVERGHTACARGLAPLLVAAGCCLAGPAPVPSCSDAVTAGASCEPNDDAGLFGTFCWFPTDASLRYCSCQYHAGKFDIVCQ